MDYSSKRWPRRLLRRNITPICEVEASMPSWYKANMVETTAARRRIKAFGGSRSTTTDAVTPSASSARNEHTGNSFHPKEYSCIRGNPHRGSKSLKWARPARECLRNKTHLEDEKVAVWRDEPLERKVPMLGLREAGQRIPTAFEFRPA